MIGNASRRQFMALGGMSMAAAANPAQSGGNAAPSGAGAPPPNVLWICTDQQRWDTIHALGNPHIRTPHIDRLAAEGVSFTHAYCQNPICTPSRASFLTGCIPSRIHQHRNGNAEFPAKLTPRLVTRRLASAGYDGALCGKLHLASPFGREEPRIDDGYRIYDWSHQPKPEPGWPDRVHAYNRWLHEHGVTWEGLYRKRKIAGYPEQYNAGMPAEFHELAWEAERTLHYIEGGLKGPWFASINIFAPHNPFDPAPEYLEKMTPQALPMPLYREGEEREQARFAGKVAHQTMTPAPPASYPARHMKACYYAMIEHIDWYVGRVVEALERTGQRENTLIVFMSDHGEMMGDHCLRLKGCRFFEGAVRVPLILSWPGGGLQKGLRSDALVELTDVAPTLLEAAGIPDPGDMDGKSLLGLARGAAETKTHRDFVWSEYHDSQTNELQSHASMIRDRSHKHTLNHGTGLGELFDLEADPHEFENLFEKPEHARLRQRMADQLIDTLALHTDLGSPRIGKY